jgi:hypothetical protein
MMMCLMCSIENDTFEEDRIVHQYETCTEIARAFLQFYKNFYSIIDNPLTILIISF